MEENPPSQESANTSLADLVLPDVPVHEAPVKHPVRFLDPVVVDNHFRPLLGPPPSPEESWRRKGKGIPFPGL